MRPPVRVRREKRLKNQGSALVTIIVIMLVIMGIVSALVEHLVVNEVNAVEESLARVRAYWAMVGQVNYILSRVRYEGSQGKGFIDASGKALDATKLAGINAYIGELDGYNWPWYPEYGTNTSGNPRYRFRVTVTAAEKTPTKLPDVPGSDVDGYFVLTFAQASPCPSGNASCASPDEVIPAIQSIYNQISTITADVCIGNSTTATANCVVDATKENNGISFVSLFR